MKISQKLEYACRALAQLAKHHDGTGVMRLEEISRRESVSGPFLLQIMNDLRRAGVVASRRGQSGGYLLARPPAEITLRDIVEAVDPQLLQRTVSGHGESGTRVKTAWDGISSGVESSLGHIPLDALTKHDGPPMFHI